jgi:hypothetical protein
MGMNTFVLQKQSMDLYPYMSTNTFACGSCCLMLTRVSTCVEGQYAKQQQT